MLTKRLITSDNQQTKISITLSLVPNTKGQNWKISILASGQ